MLASAFVRVTGPSLADAYVIAVRFDEARGFDRACDESWVLTSRAGALVPLHGEQGWYVALWLSPAGRLFVADWRGRVLICDDPAAPVLRWSEYPLPFIVTGLFGLDDDCVFAFSHTAAPSPMARWDGHAWRPVVGPPGEVLAMHGTAPDLVVAVGLGGMIARWDGAAWHAMESPTSEVLSSVFVVDANEMYACGRGERLLEGSTYGWSLVTRGGMMTAVAKWRGRVWIGDALSGLHRLEHDALVSVDPALKPIQLAPRDDRMLALASARVVELRGDDAALGASFAAWDLDAALADQAWRGREP